MAQSKTANKLAEIARILPSVAAGIDRVTVATDAMFDAEIRRSETVGPQGGGSGPTILGPTGAPVAPSGGGFLPQGGGSILDFLQRLADAQGRERTTSGGPGGGGSGGGYAAVMRPATGEESTRMKVLGESLDYVRKLAAAAQWAKLDMFIVMRAPKQERDALIAAYEASVTESMVSGKGSGGGGYNSHVGQVDPRYGDFNFVGPRRQQGNPNIDPRFGDFNYVGPTRTSTAASTAQAATSAAQSAKASADAAESVADVLRQPDPQLTAVVDQLQSLNRLIASKGDGLAVRTGGV